MTHLLRLSGTSDTLTKTAETWKQCMLLPRIIHKPVYPGGMAWIRDMDNSRMKNQRSKLRKKF
jgi:hypothetical protein